MTNTTSIIAVNPAPANPVANSKPVRKPFYYVRKRFLANKPAVFGLATILLSILIAILGYLLMPDHTPNANDSAPQIKKKPPGFTIMLMKQRKNAPLEEHNFFVRMFNGQESAFNIIPIVPLDSAGGKLVTIDQTTLTVSVRVFGREGEVEKHSLVDAVLPLFVGRSFKLGMAASNAVVENEDGNFRIEGEKVTYLDLDENVIQTNKKELIESFQKECLEQRTYILGTDIAGRDLLSRLLFGFRISLGIGVVAVLISLLVGLSLGSLAGFFGGYVDAFIMWLMTVVWSIPSIMLVIAISLALQSRGIWVAFVAVGLTTWVEIARTVRGQILGIKEKLFVEAARSLGLKNDRIIIRHILPNIMGPLIVILASNFASAILTEAGLSFLGLGVQPPMPSWGSMIYEGFNVIGSSDSFHLVFYPSLFISLLVLAFNLFGNGLRDAYDPTTRR
jgi:ABC-type dipeptide/oligopeptide/nickel transport system permease subunit